MKKKIIITTLLILLCILFIPIHSSNAESENSFTITNVSDSSITYNIKFENYPLCKTNVVYVGQKLSDITAIGYIQKNGMIKVCNYTWENPTYVLVNGNQSVNLICQVYNGESFTFTIAINPANEGWKPLFYSEFKDYIFERYEGSTLEEIVPINVFWTTNNVKVKGTITYSNYEDLSIGYHEIGWTFIPDDKSYKTKSGIYKVQIIPRPNTVETLDVTELTTETLMLTETGSSYDVNVENSIAGSTYTWTSSDTKVAKVNSKSGLVTAVSDGEAEITCRIEKGADVQILSTEVIVGDDDNKVQLTETELDLEVGDLFDVDVENRISGSKYYWKSSNKSIVKVTSTTGKVTALKSGTCTITCIIRTPNKEVIVLQCEINVD